MTLAEKASLMSGANFWNTKPFDRLGIPSIMLTDGPHGVRKQGGKEDNLGLNKSIPSTCYPTASTLACSWDVDLLRKVGECLGREAAALDVSVLLGPGLNIKRNPLCGRNFEYFSEDPYLTGKLAAAMISGIQSEGISACPKHFAVNSQEHRRMVIDEVVDERSLRELYLEGFRYAVQEGKPKTLMSSYNKVNGTHANENTHLMQDILYGEWEFDGVVVTDWGAENDRVAGLIAGNQLEMPSTAGFTDAEIVAAVQAGTLSESLLDERVDSLLRLVFEYRPEAGKGKGFPARYYHEQAIEAARRSMVLLKNEDRALPLAQGCRVAVIGDFAKTPRYQGAGSSLVQPTILDNTLDALKKTDLDIVGYAPGFKRLGGKSRMLRLQAVRLAKKAETVLLFLGLDEGSEAEGMDRQHMRLNRNQVELLDELQSVTPNIVVVLSGGVPVEMPWIHQAKAVLHGYLGGQGGGTAIADLLAGRANPCGKLAETYPLRYEDVPSSHLYPGQQLTSEHREGIYIGYRYFDTAGVPVLFPFGFGLSYTTFRYENLRVSGNAVSFDLENTGDFGGEEIAELYVSKKDAVVFRANRELKGFAKVHLEPKERKTVEIDLDEHAFAYFNVIENDWIVEPGEYQVLVGASSQDIRLSSTVAIAGSEVRNPYDRDQFAHYYAADVFHIGEDEFARMLGHVPPKATWDENEPLGINDTIGQGKYKRGFGRFLYRLTLFIRNWYLLRRNPIMANNVMFGIHLPFRNFHRMSGGIIDRAMLDGIMVMVNGNFWKGLGQLARAVKAKKQRGRENPDGQ